MYYEVEIVNQLKSVIIGFVPEGNPIDIPPGMSKKFGKSIGLSSNSRIVLNRKIKANRSLGRLKKVIGVGYEHISNTCFFTIEGKLYCKEFN